MASKISSAAALSNLKNNAHIKGRANRYDPYTLFFTGLGLALEFGVTPVALFFLTLERCLALRLATAYLRRQRNAVLAASIGVEALVGVLVVNAQLSELPLNTRAGEREGAGGGGG